MAVPLTPQPLPLRYLPSHRLRLPWLTTRFVRGKYFSLPTFLPSFRTRYGILEMGLAPMYIVRVMYMRAEAHSWFL